MAEKPIDIRQMVVRRRDACVQFRDGKPARDRKEALQFYNGTNLDLYGDSGDGLSTVVSRDTMEAIESVMPPLVRPFVAGEQVVSFEPVEEADEDAVEQATEYVNHVFRRHNNELQVAQTALKDGLLFRLGIAKTVMEETEEGTPETFDGLDEAQMQALQMGVQGEGREIAGDIGQDPVTGLYSATVAPRKVKRFRVHVVAPDEFLYEPRLPGLGEASFLGHSRRIQLGDLIAMGIDEKKAKALRPGKASEERDARFEDEDDDPAEEAPTDDLSREVQVDECYIRCDYEGTGVLSWRKVMLGGNTSTLLLDEPSDAPNGEHPYSAWTPIPVPHKLEGLSMWDLTKDIQMQQTAIKREGMNALYLANRPMREVSKRAGVNIDDLLNPSVGGFVRVDEIGHIREIPSGGTGVLNNVLAMSEALSSDREARTGVTRYNQGMDSNSLNKTATGMNIIASNSQQRQELVARQFGEFLKDIFEKLLALVTQHADPADVERLTGKPFVPWPSEYDTTVSVGLGTNNKDQLVGHVMALLQLDEKIIQLQQGLNGPLLTAQNVYDKLMRLPEAMGLKGQFYTDPSTAEEMAPQAQEPPEDPLAETKLEQQTELQKEAMRQETELQKEAMRQQPVVVPINGMGGM